MAEQEICVKDYIEVILKRKLVIVWFFLISVVSVIAMTMVMPKTYEAYAIIKNGSFNGEIVKDISSRDMLLSPRILYKVVETFEIKVPIHDFRRSIKIEDISDMSCMKITVKDKSSKKAKEICEMFSKIYLDYGNNLCTKKKGYFYKKLHKINGQLNLVEKNMSDIADEMTRLSSGGAETQTESTLKLLLLRSIYLDCLAQMNKLSDKKDFVKSILDGASKFEIISEPFEVEFPVSPKKKQIIIASIILSLFAGIIVVFVMEYWQRNFYARDN